MRTLPLALAAFAASVLLAALGLFSDRLAAAGASSRVQPVFSKALPNVPGKTMTAVTVEYDPGAASKPHHHAGVVFAYVLAGAVRSQVDSEAARVYHAGEFFFEGPGAHHVVSENASASEPAKLLAVIVADDGAKLTTVDP